VRHILLAEPLVRDFARCFDGLEPAQAEALADCFRFERCVVRKPLAELLELHLKDSSSI
jgi:endoglucanase